MATKNEVHTHINMVISVMRVRGALPYGYATNAYKTLTWHQNSLGYSLVWEERNTGGVQVIARLGKTKPQVIDNCRMILDVLDTIGRAE